MTGQAGDHLGRALTALNRLISPAVDPAALAGDGGHSAPGSGRYDLEDLAALVAELSPNGLYQQSLGADTCL